MGGTRLTTSHPATARPHADNRQEAAAAAAAGQAAAVSEPVPPVPVVCSHSVGQLGLLERENAAILNAALLVRITWALLVHSTWVQPGPAF